MSGNVQITNHKSQITNRTCHPELVEGQFPNIVISLLKDKIKSSSLYNRLLFLTCFQ
jgi:hypothetical protein